jgi:hypothetical protein
VKWMFFVLLAANLAVAAVIYVRECLPDPDAQVVSQQLNSEKIRILPPPLPSAPVPVAVAAAKAPGACVQWGSFGAAELPRAQAAVDRLTFADRARKTEVPVLTSYWVYIGPLASRSELEKRTVELNRLGIIEYLPIVETGRWRFSASLGVFRTEEGAKNYVAALRAKGVQSAQSGEREQRITQTAFVFRDLNASQTGELAGLKGAYPGSDIRSVDCPAP